MAQSSANTTFSFNAVTITKMIAFSGINPQRSQLDTTHLTSANSAREFIVGLVDSGSPSIEINYDQAEASHAGLLTAFDAGTVGNIVVTMPSANTWTASGFVSGFSWAAESAGDAVVHATVTFRTTGKWTRA